MKTASPIQVLIIEDSPTDVLLTEEALGNGRFHIQSRDRLGDALKLLMGNQFNVILLDLGLPDSQGLETLRTLRSNIPRVAIVVLTGKDDEELALQALKEGAQDYLVKGQVQGEVLGRCIRYAIERKQGEETLRDAEARNAAILESSLDAIISLDHAGIILGFNPAAERIFGFTQKEALGQQIEELIIPPRQRKEHSEGLSRFGAGSSSEVLNERLEINARRKDGSEFPMELTLTRIRSDGPPIYTGFMRDITKRKLSEQSLKLFRALIDHSTDAIEVIDPATGHFIDMNEKGCEDLQYSRDEIMRLGVMDIDPLVARGGWEHTLESIRRTNSLVLETEHRRKDGSRFPVEINTKLVRMDREYLVTVVRDITERKKSEEALHQSEERFRQAQKMEAVGQLAGGVAHDFNNLLTIISGYSEIVLSMLDPSDPMRESVKAIGEAGERAASLTRQLLAFSRQTVLEPKVLDLNEVVKETEKLLRRLIGEDILLTAVLDPTIGRVKVDPGQLGQVLMNLAVNARDAMPKGGKLTLETRNIELDEGYAQLRPELKPGWYVLLSISDTGSGMPEAVKKRIFEPFFTTKGVGKGTGLGLAVVLGVVKQSGGHVEVYSELDIGTTFKIYLPAVKEKTSESKLIEFGNGGRGTETILVVEDEDGVRGLAVLVLQSYGYKVIAARDGKEALRLVAKHQGDIHLMLTDVVMPGMGGPDLAEALQATLPNMKVLFSSGYTDDAVLRHGLLQEKVAFIQKPYSPLSLARKVRQVLDAK